MSAKIGFAEFNSIQLAVEVNVYDGKIISSFFFKPHIEMDASRAFVQLWVKKIFFDLIVFSIYLSVSLLILPSVSLLFFKT